MRLELSCFNLGEKNPDLPIWDGRCRNTTRRWELIRPLNPPDQQRWTRQRLKGLE